MDDTEKTALVTGASRGIGMAVLTALAQHGWRVYGTATSAQGVEQINAALENQGLPGRGLTLQAESSESIAAAIKAIADERHTPLALVNNLGITHDTLLVRMAEEDWQRVLDVNLGSVYRLCKACVRGMLKARWGRIVNVVSVAALMGNPGQCNYTASKAGIGGFSRSLAHELAARGVTVNCVAPGFIDTDMSKQLSAEQRQAVLERIPLGRFGDSREVADLVAFLASEKAAYITGETINVNGGLYMA